MSDELHPATKLLLARIESHPDEFKDEYLLSEVYPSARGNYMRWDSALRAIREHGSVHDIEAISAALRPIRMEQIHEWAMDELLNGEERRRKKREAKEYYEHMVRQQQAQLQQKAGAQLQQHHAMRYANQINTLTSAAPTTSTSLGSLAKALKLKV